MGERITFVFEKQHSGQWIGTSPERKGFIVAEPTLVEALEQAAHVLRAIEDRMPE